MKTQSTEIERRSEEAARNRARLRGYYLSRPRAAVHHRHRHLLGTGAVLNNRRA